MNCCIVCCKGIVHIILELEVIVLLVLYQKSKQDIVMSKFRRVMTISVHWGGVAIGRATLTFGRCLYIGLRILLMKKNTAILYEYGILINCYSTLEYIM